jgi:formiminoglutamase
MHTASIQPPASTIPQASKADDPRMGTFIQSFDVIGRSLSEWNPAGSGTEHHGAPDVVILGFPYDEGCLRNGGRPGALEGPASFRKFLKAMGTAVNPEYSYTGGIELKDLKVVDGGDIPAGLPLEEAHQILERTVLKVLQSGATPFVVGGGNDQSSSNGKAFLTALEGSAIGGEGHSSSSKCPALVINLDAHLDVRPRIEPGSLIHSGCPFRDLLMDSRMDGVNFIEFASQGSQCSKIHADFVQEKGGSIIWMSEFRNGGFDGRAFDGPAGSSSSSSNPKQQQLGGDPSQRPQDVMRRILATADQRRLKTFFSFDIDSISGADCPGVSCPGTHGLSSEEALALAFEAGFSPSMRLVDLSELNPVVEGYRTPRLAVNIFYYFLLGRVAQKSQAVSGAAGTPDHPSTRKPNATSISKWFGE